MSMRGLPLRGQHVAIEHPKTIRLCRANVSLVVSGLLRRAERPPYKIILLTNCYFIPAHT